MEESNSSKTFCVPISLKLCQYPVTYHPIEFLKPIDQIETMSLCFFPLIWDCCTFVQPIGVTIRHQCSFSPRKERLSVPELWQCGDMASNSNILVFDAYGIMAWSIIMLRILMSIYLATHPRVKFPRCYYMQLLISICTINTALMKIKIIIITQVIVIGLTSIFYIALSSI